MTFKIYCAIKQIKGKSGAGIVITGIEHTREFTWPLRLTPPKLSTIQTARLALCSMLPKFRRHNTIMYIENLDLEDNNYAESIESLKQWMEYYPNLEIMPPDGSEYFKKAQSLALEAARTQKKYDSGTKQNHKCSNQATI